MEVSLEKISQIVRSNARVAAVDLNTSGSVRPGTPGFGRATPESRGASFKEISTADRATLAANELADQRRVSEGKIVDQLAHDFFQGKNDFAGPATAVSAGPAATPAAIRNAMSDLGPAPSGYTPRGTFVDVRA